MNDGVDLMCHWPYAPPPHFFPSLSRSLCLLISLPTTLAKTHPHYLPYNRPYQKQAKIHSYTPRPLPYPTSIHVSNTHNHNPSMSADTRSFMVSPLCPYVYPACPATACISHLLHPETISFPLEFSWVNWVVEARGGRGEERLKGWMGVREERGVWCRGEVDYYRPFLRRGRAGYVRPRKEGVGCGCGRFRGEGRCFLFLPILLHLLACGFSDGLKVLREKEDCLSLFLACAGLWVLRWVERGGTLCVVRVACCVWRGIGSMFRNIGYEMVCAGCQLYSKTHFRFV
ncbi:hypothetical protein BDR22DRAFT_401971 [Usnea florida]